MNQARYAELKQSLSDIETNKSPSYEGSMCYELDINSFNGDNLGSLDEKYEEINTAIENVNTTSNEYEYKKLSTNITNAKNTFSSLISKVGQLKEIVEQSSKRGYNELANDYNISYTRAQTNLDKALSAMNSYDTICGTLRSMSSDDPNYSSTVSAKEACVTTYNTALDLVSTEIATLENILNDGYKRA